MAKEITLEELARSSSQNNAKPIIKTDKVVEPKRTEPTNTVVPTSGIKTSKPISMADLGKNLEAKNPEAKQKLVEEDAPLVANAFSSMDKVLAEKKKFYDEQVFPVMMENAREMAMEKELGMSDEETVADNVTVEEDVDDFKDLVDEKVESVSTPNTESIVMPTVEESKPVAKKESKIVEMAKKEEDTTTLDDMMKDLGLDEEDTTADIEDEETTEELRERFKASLSSVKITRNPIDLSKFQIAKEPVSSAMVLNSISNTSKKKCDHPLVHTRRNMTFEECSGPELDALRKTIKNSNGVNGVIASLRFVYNHVIDANKKSFEAWCKSIRTEDIESLYYGMYKACYGDTNLVARTDAKAANDSKSKGCDKTSLIDTPIDSMIKYKDDEVKQLYETLMNQDTTSPGDKVKSQLMVISDDFVVSYTDPTLYSTFIQYASLNPDIVDKYNSHLNTMAYIDGFFRIDAANNKLIPIAIKEYPNNLNKSTMSKLKTYIDILKTLTNDQYNVMVAKLDNVIGESKISYIHPETTCPECGNTISEEPVDSMLNLLFTRAQLVQVKSL